MAGIMVTNVIVLTHRFILVLLWGSLLRFNVSVIASSFSNECIWGLHCRGGLGDLGLQKLP